MRGAAAIDWLIVGLGNPGREYQRTRHNIGFLVADQLAERWQLPKPKQRFRGRITEGPVVGGGFGDAPGGAAAGGEAFAAWPGGAPAGTRPRVAILWPLTYMNDVGRSVGPARGSYKLPLERLLVVHDEIDIPFGEIRTRLGGGLAGHNGLKSLKRELGGGDFIRIRVGVGRPDSTDPEIVSAHVLGRFSEPDRDVAQLVQRACQAVQDVVLAPPES